MQWLYVGASPRGWCCMVLLALCSGCQGEVSEPSSAGAPEAGGAAVAVSSNAVGECEPLDDADTTCDTADDDCDGALDEDCDFGPTDCPANTHIVEGTRGRDMLWGTSGADCILGYGGNDLLSGFGGNDVLVGGAGDDTLSGWDGNDALFGDRGNDALFGDRGNDRLDGGEGNDFLMGGEGNDHLTGGACNDKLVGISGTDTLYGDDGSDRILATRQHQVDGGSGVDTCSGTSCELSQTARLCRRDADCGVGQVCVEGSMVCVLSTDLVHTDDTCDGYDDDCDGEIDEDYAGVETSCGVGACAATGTTSCHGGALVDSCTPGVPAESDATCDAIDDDCDGSADEAYVPLVTTCEVNGCLAHGPTACTAGVQEDLCMSQPTCFAEVWCEDDAVDNDGDGYADCADRDCAGQAHCAPQEFDMTVFGRTNLWGAGHTTPPGSGASQLPLGIALRHRGGAVLTFSNVSGTIFDFERAWGPDGMAGATNVPNAGGIAGYRLYTAARGMIGVFLSDAEPIDPAPERLTIADGAFTQLSPGLEQAFFIGDGLTSSGMVQRFIVPAGATRFFLGHADSCSSTVPGCFSDNAGMFEAHADLRFDPQPE